ncbi:LysR family transcriptional regulator [Paracidovorax anthurii]|uniref:LysR family transcriptional regulator n=1 Tax=Paracidovorax anthurii TaxID=78229 RepID=A0A328Z6B9_9BURK|nr:LysR family transcriptional regulator [Paracidovorax anthurii]
MTFDAVARRQSFSQAADDLSLSYSAVSHRVRELEKLLGTKLFNRTTRVVSLSPEGAYLHQQMKASLEMLEAAFSGFAHERDVIRISALPSFGRFRLVPALTDFHRTHPSISIALQPTTRLVNLNQGEADIAIRFARDKPDAFHAERLLEDEWFPVASPRYLQQIGKRSLPELFKRADLLTHSRQAWEPWLQAAKLEISPAQRNLTYTDTGFMLDAALNQQGIALGRRSLVKGLLQDGALVRVSNISIPSSQAYFLLASERAVISRHGTTVMDWLRSLFVDG